MKENILIEKSIDFGARIVKLHRYLVKEKRETVLSKQILRSGTSIGANINEAQYGQSKADFISKLQIALKETAETEYWLHILQKSDYLDEQQAGSLLNDCLEIKRILISSVNTAKNGMDNNQPN
ncbi:MAG: four helix bundle protein [Clostridiales bacterium]|nr:four helix bundle protein [Clostridiales bacterium]